MENNVDIDKLKRIIELGKSLSKKEHQELLNKLTDKELKRLKHLELGLSKEDEFILISRLLGKCISIQKIDQSKNISNTNFIPPDLIATYKKNIDTSPDDIDNTVSMFIEVKRCYKEFWKISNQDFDRRVRFAKMNEKPLYFAINFIYSNMNLWTLFPSEFIKKNKFKIHFMQWENSYFELIVGNLIIHFKEFGISKIYSKTAKSISIHPKYGGIEKIIIDLDGEQFEFLGNDSATLVFYVLNSIGDKIIENDHIIQKKYYLSQITTLYQILIGCIKVIYGNEENFNFAKYLKQIVENGDEIINLKLGHYIVEKMESIGIATHFIWDPKLS